MLSVVKMMKEQGNQFDWSQIAIDIPSLPCFKPEAEWPWEKVSSGTAVLADILAEGYAAVDRFIVRVTGENPSVGVGDDAPVFVNCEPVIVSECKVISGTFEVMTVADWLPLTPIRTIHLDSSGKVSNLSEAFGVQVPSIGSDIAVMVYFKVEEETLIIKTVVCVLGRGS